MKEQTLGWLNSQLHMKHQLIEGLALKPGDGAVKEVLCANYGEPIGIILSLLETPLDLTPLKGKLPLTAARLCVLRGCLEEGLLDTVSQFVTKEDAEVSSLALLLEKGYALHPLRGIIPEHLQFVVQCATCGRDLSLLITCLSGSGYSRLVTLGKEDTDKMVKLFEAGYPIECTRFTGHTVNALLALVDMGVCKRSVIYALKQGTICHVFHLTRQLPFTTPIEKLLVNQLFFLPEAQLRCLTASEIKRLSNHLTEDAFYVKKEEGYAWLMGALLAEEKSTLSKEAIQTGMDRLHFLSVLKNASSLPGLEGKSFLLQTLSALPFTTFLRMAFSDVPYNIDHCYRMQNQAFFDLANEIDASTYPKETQVLLLLFCRGTGPLHQTSGYKLYHYLEKRGFTFKTLHEVFVLYNTEANCEVSGLATVLTLLDSLTDEELKGNWNPLCYGACKNLTDDASFLAAIKTSTNIWGRANQLNPALAMMPCLALL